LLKNGKTANTPLLPLDKNAQKILVVGAHANDIGLQCGGWTITWQGSAGNTTLGNSAPPHFLSLFVLLLSNQRQELCFIMSSAALNQ
jgi:beta-glucosidase-like glycosyl hydrolase